MSEDADMAMDVDGGAYTYTAAVARDLLRAAQGGRSTSKDRHDALVYLNGAVSNAYPMSANLAAHEDLFVLAAQNIPALLAEFPKEKQVASDAIWDLCEMELTSVRFVAYDAVIQMLEIGLSATYIREAADLLLQALSWMDEMEGVAEIEKVRKTLNSIFSTDPEAFVNFISQTLQDNATEGHDRRTHVLWEFLRCDESLGSRGRLYATKDDIQGIFIDVIGAAMEADKSKRVQGLSLLIPCPMLTGALSDKKNSTFLLDLILKYTLEVGDNELALPYLECLTAFDIRATHKPDPRRYLELFCDLPFMTYGWAKKEGVERPKEGDSPSKLMDWLLSSWVLWKKEYKVVVNQRPQIALTRLGPRVAKTALAQVPIQVDIQIRPNTTFRAIQNRMEDLEILLVTTYFVFLKFHYNINDLFANDALKEKIKQFGHLAEQGLAEALKEVKPKVSVRRWENVANVCTRFVDPPEDHPAVLPSWKTSSDKVQPVKPDPQPADTIKAEPEKLPLAMPLVTPKVEPSEPSSSLRQSKSTAAAPISPDTIPTAPPAAQPRAPPTRPRQSNALVHPRLNGVSTPSRNDTRPRQQPLNHAQAPRSSAAASVASTQNTATLSMASGSRLPPTGPASSMVDSRSASTDRLSQKRKRPEEENTAVLAGNASGSSPQPNALSIHGRGSTSNPAPPASMSIAGTSLLSRLGIAPALPDVNRANEPRQSDRSDASARKKPKTDEQMFIRGGGSKSLSLLSRMSNGPSGPPPNSESHSSNSARSTTPSLLDRLRAPNPSAPSKSISPIERPMSRNAVAATSAAVLPTRIPTPPPPVLDPSPAVAIAPLPSTATLDSGIVRKGRGFQNKGTLTSPASSPTVAAFSVRGAGSK